MLFFEYGFRNCPGAGGQGRYADRTAGGRGRHADGRAGTPAGAAGTPVGAAGTPVGAAGTTYGFASLAVERCARPDHIDVLAVPLPAGAPTDPRWWARQIFSIEAAPAWVRGLFAGRTAVVPLLGIPTRPEENPFRVVEETGGEALIATHDRHLDFYVGVGTGSGLVRLTTVVQLHGWRGRLYWSVVRFFHGPVAMSMLQRTVASAASAASVPADAAVASPR